MIMKRIGLVAGSFKPFTAGHYNLIKKASDECQQAILFVSTGDRKRKGELSLSWAQMKPVWEQYLHPTINKLRNVEIIYVSQPVRAIYELLIAANQDLEDSNAYVLYSDPTDMQNCYSETVQLRYWSRLVKNKQVIVKPVDREETAGISGTRMRSALARGDKNVFIHGLPTPVQKYGIDIFRILNI